MNQRAERNLAAVGAAHVELVDVLNVCARVALRFDVGLPLAAEAVEVVHQVSAHERLHGGVDVAQVDLLLRGLFLVDICIELWDGRKIGGNGRGDLLALGDRAEKGEEIFREEGRIVVAGAILRESW